MDTLTNELERIAAELSNLDTGAPAATVRELITDALSERYELPRGVVLDRTERGGLYLEHKRNHEGTRTDHVNVKVYGQVHRAGRTSSGGVECYWRPWDEEQPLRCYWANMTGASVPDGARAAVAAAVRAELEAVMTPELWATLATECDAANHEAKVRRHISEAVRAVNDARRALGVKVGYR